MGCEASQLAPRDDSLIVQTCPAISDDVGGKISISCQSPITCFCSDISFYNTTKYNAYASNVSMGTYTVDVLFDASRTKRQLSVRIDVFDMICVLSYDVTDASSDLTRDGSVKANIINMDQYDGLEFLWTSGVVTDTPILHDVPPGIYAVSVVSRNNIVIPFCHITHPAQVTIKKLVETI